MWYSFLALKAFTKFFKLDNSNQQNNSFILQTKDKVLQLIRATNVLLDEITIVNYNLKY